MIILDENIGASQRELLTAWRFHVRHIGVDAGRAGMSDEDVVTLLRRQTRPTYVTRDEDFYDPSLCHSKYSLVCLVVENREVARYVRRFMRHPACKTWAQRSGRLFRVSRRNLIAWQTGLRDPATIEWT